MHLKSRFDAGNFVILAEMEPPKGVDASGMLSNALKVKGCVDAFIVPEMSSAVMRMSALGSAVLIQDKSMETVMQVCCRDRNRLALQGDILAASACGIENLMVVTGDVTTHGDHHTARPVHDLDEMELISAIGGMGRGRDLAGVELDGTPSFCLFARVNAGAPGVLMDEELRLMDQKVELGVDAFITPPIFDIESMGTFLKKKGDSRNKIIPTVLLLKSVGMARYLSRNVENVHVPDTVIQRIQKSPDKARECVSIAKETIDLVRKEGFAGVNIVALGWEDKLPEILGIV